MMKKHISTLLILFYFTATYAQLLPSFSQKELSYVFPYTLADFGLHGNIKTITETSYTRGIGGKYEQNSTYNYSFDASGKVTEARNILMFSGISMGTVVTKYAYDAQGRIATLSWGDEKQTGDETTTFKYNEQGNQISKEHVAKGQTTKETYAYDSRNRLAAINYFHAGESSPYSVLRFTCDEQSRIVSTEREYTKEKTKTISKYTYTAAGTMPVSYRYDDNLSDNFSYPAGSDMEYNAQDNLIAFKAVEAGTVSSLKSNTCSYVYDDKQNWTKKTTEGFGAGYEERKITYYSADEMLTPSQACKKALDEYVKPCIESYSKLVVAANKELKPAAQSLAEFQKIAEQIKTVLPKLEKVKSPDGNNAPELAINYLNFIISAPHRSDLNAYFNQPENKDLFRKIATDGMTYKKPYFEAYKLL